MLNKTDKNFVVRKLKLYIPAQNPTSLTTLNAVLGQNGINVFEFTKQFSELTKDYLKDIILNIEIRIFADKKFDISIKGPTTGFMCYEQVLFFNQEIKEVDLNSLPSKIKASDLYKIAIFIKAVNHNQLTVKSIFKSLLGTVKSMHLEVYNDVD